VHEEPCSLSPIGLVVAWTPIGDPKQMVEQAAFRDFAKAERCLNREVSAARGIK
jgi:hypothetical protein